MEQETPEIAGIPYSFADHPAGKYLQELKNYYISRATVNESEDYVDDSLPGSEPNYADPFVSLKDRITNAESYITI
jgi:hypothetical protein